MSSKSLEKIRQTLLYGYTCSPSLTLTTLNDNRNVANTFFGKGQGNFGGGRDKEQILVAATLHYYAYRKIIAGKWCLLDFSETKKQFGRGTAVPSGPRVL